MDWSWMYGGIAIVVLNNLVLLVWKPWAQAYTSEKGRNLARKEDLDKILLEVRTVTAAQKEIESKISGELWDRQMKWNQRRDTYARLLEGVERMRLAFQDALRQRETYDEDPASSKSALAGAAGRALEALVEFRRAKALALLFSSKEAISVLARISDAVEPFRYTPISDNPVSYAPTNEAAASLKRISIDAIQAGQENLVDAAKKDLGFSF
ncbi:MAG: hypothetical protein AAB403_08115 [Planctomycetota bacterium]